MLNLAKLTLLVLLLSFPVYGFSQAATTEPVESEAATVAVEHDSGIDERIKKRIEGIFGEMDSLAAVQIQVKEGVVTLAGETANQADAEKAQRLSSRLEGVVAVEDQIDRTLNLRENVEPVIDRFKQHSKTLLKAFPLLVLAVIAVILSTMAGAFLSRRKTFLNKITPNAFLAELLGQALRILGFVLGLIFALNLLGASKIVATLLGGAGVIGLAIGFAVRDTIENYIASIMLSLRQPFRVKDHVFINEHEGIVVRLTSRSTLLMTLGGNHLRIPNSTVFKGIILNFSTNPERRFQFELGVDATDDPVAAMQTGLKTIKSLDFVLTDPPPSAIIETVGDSNIVISFRAWVDQRTSDYGKARSLCIRAVMRVLEDQGFTLPEPIYRLRFDPGLDSALQKRIGSQAAPEADSAKPKPQREEMHPLKIQPTVDESSLDVSPDTHLNEKVDEEIMVQGENDLLDDERPRE